MPGSSRKALAVAALVCMAAGSAEPGVLDGPLGFQLTPQDDAAALAPVALSVPHGYAPAQEAMHASTGPLLSVLMLYPSYGPFQAGPARCGSLMCGDEVGATFSLLAAPPAARAATGPLRAEMEAQMQAAGDKATFEDTPPPPGYLESFAVTKAALPGRAYTYSHTEYLTYRDASGAEQVATCGVEGPHPSCGFRSYDPATHLAMTFSLPRSALAQRDAIGSHLRAMFAAWQVPGQ